MAFRLAHATRAALVFCAAACSSDPGGTPTNRLPNTASGPPLTTIGSSAGTPSAVGVAGAGAEHAPGMIQSMVPAGPAPTPVNPGTAPPSGVQASGAAGARAGGSDGQASAAGVGGPQAGTSAAQTGQAGATAIGGANAAGSGSGGVTGTGYIREADPTDASIKHSGEYMVKSYTEAMGLVGGMQYGDAALLGDGSELYYPVGATPPFASVVIVPGFTAQRADIAPWASFLASHGIVGLAIDTNTVLDQPDVRSRGLVEALDSLKKENMRADSPVQGKLDTSRMGVMGWSMGGGGTWITADSHPELQVAVSLCGWISKTAGSSTKVPSLQLAVKDDELAAGMSQPVYAAIANNTPKMIVEWSSGGHWTNNTPSNQDNQVGAFGLAWIKVFLENDDRYRKFFKLMPAGASDFRTNQ